MAVMISKHGDGEPMRLSDPVPPHVNDILVVAGENPKVFHFRVTLIMPNELPVMSKFGCYIHERFECHITLQVLHDGTRSMTADAKTV